MGWGTSTVPRISRDSGTKISGEIWSGRRSRILPWKLASNTPWQALLYLCTIFLESCSIVTVLERALIWKKVLDGMTRRKSRDRENWEEFMGFRDMTDILTGKRDPIPPWWAPKYWSLSTDNDLPDKVGNWILSTWLNFAQMEIYSKNIYLSPPP